MSELKECPFCGGEAHIHFAQGSNQIFVEENGLVTTSPMLYIVSCESCHAKTAPCSSVTVAQSLWNARAET